RPGDACVARRRPGRSERPRRPVGHRGGDRDRGEPGHGKSWLRRVGDGPGRRGPRREPGHRQRGHHGAGRRPTRHAARPAVVAVPDRHDGGLPMRRPLLLLALVLLAAARPAVAVCTAADVMACGSSCWTCTGFTCTIAKLLPVTRAACTFDFGARNIVLAGGGFTAGANAFEIKAHGLTVSFDGTLKATGNRDTHGGTSTLTLGAGGLTVLPGANVIDLTGARLAGISPGGGGTFSVFSDGDITLGGPDIVVDGTTTDADGGMILLNAGRLSGTSLVASGSITVRANLSAMAKTNGSGGTVMLVANGSGTSGRIDVEQRVDVTGGAGGGTINSMSSGDTILGTTPSGGPLLVADANGDGSDGGEIDVAAGGQVRGNNGATGPLRARGSTGFFPGDPGGFGGTFCIDATGALTLGGSSGGIDASGGQSGCGGSIQLATDNYGADLTLAVPLYEGAGG